MRRMRRTRQFEMPGIRQSLGEPGTRSGRREGVQRAVQDQGRLAQVRQFGTQIGVMQHGQTARQCIRIGLGRLEQSLSQPVQQGFLSRHAARLQAQKTQQRCLCVGHQGSADGLTIDIDKACGK